MNIAGYCRMPALILTKNTFFELDCYSLYDPSRVVVCFFLSVGCAYGYSCSRPPDDETSFRA